VADEKALEILNQGPSVWNEWREKELPATPDLSGANLSQVDLRLTNLRGAILRGAGLTWANFSGTNLAEANLGGRGFMKPCLAIRI